MHCSCTALCSNPGHYTEYLSDVRHHNIVVNMTHTGGRHRWRQRVKLKSKKSQTFESSQHRSCRRGLSCYTTQDTSNSNELAITVHEYCSFCYATLYCPDDDEISCHVNCHGDGYFCQSLNIISSNDYMYKYPNSSSPSETDSTSVCSDIEVQ